MLHDRKSAREKERGGISDLSRFFSTERTVFDVRQQPAFFFLFFFLSTLVHSVTSLANLFRGPRIPEINVVAKDLGARRIVPAV